MRVKVGWMAGARVALGAALLAGAAGAPEGYVPAPRDADGFAPSAVLGAGARLDRLPAVEGMSVYRLDLRPIPAR